MKKVPAISTSDSRAVLGWPRGLICPDCLAELLLLGPRVVSTPAHVTFSLPSTSELLETEQPWSGCSWKIWTKQANTSATQQTEFLRVQLDWGRGKASLSARSFCC